MKSVKKKTKAILIALTLMLTITATSTLVTLPSANAHTPAWNIPTYASVTASPSPIGVGQTAEIVFWLDKLPPTAGGTGGYRWQNEMLIIKTPNGTTQTLGPFISDDVGSAYTLYTPTEVGTYTIQFSFPEQVLTQTNPLNGVLGSPSDYINDTYLASNATTALIVQQEPLPAPLSFPLPTEYWARPIEGQNTNWYTLGSFWLQSPQIVGNTQPDGTSPTTAHIMWTKPLEFGGIVGGSNVGVTGNSYYIGDPYELMFNSPIIMYGNLYYDLPEGNSPTGGGYVCVNLRTGQQIYWQNMTAPTFGQLYDYESPNQHGVVANGYLWRTVTDSKNGGTVWMAYNPLDGNWLFNLTNVPSGTLVYSPLGEITSYVLNAANKWLALWNNTAAPGELGGATSTGAWQWRPNGKNINASTAYSWNITIPTLPTAARVLKVIPDDLLLGMNGTLPAPGSWAPYTVWAISLKPETRGTMLWMQNYAGPTGNLSRSYLDVDTVNRVFIMWDKEDVQYSGYSIDNGSLMWSTAPFTENPWNMYARGGTDGTPMTLAYGMLYSTGFSGIIYCYSTANGSALWNYSAFSGLNTPYINYPLRIQCVSNGMLYVSTTEHSPNTPFIKGAMERCINAYTGQEIWTLYRYMGKADCVIADGCLIMLNHYDDQIYCVGKGPSATAVETPLTAITAGDSVVIQGTVTDTSAGTKQEQQAANFPNGVPAVSDDSMNTWMEYLYEQKPMPTNATGVNVSLDAVDPNGNYIHIGNVTSDISGTFGYSWTTPDVPGKYTITAKFAGSNSYWPSSAETYAVVSETKTVSTPTPIIASVADTYFVPAIVGLFVFVAIIGAAIMLMLRKRP